MKSRAALPATAALILTMWASSASSQTPPPPQPATYTIKDLGTLCVPTPEFGCEAAISRAFDVNNWGQVVGIAHRVGSTTLSPLLLRGFRTTPNQSLNPATDALGFGTQQQFRAYSINDAGTVVGTIGSSFPNDFEYETLLVDAAFLVQPNTQAVHTLPSVLNCPTSDPPVGCHASTAFAINNHGAFVGSAQAQPDDLLQAFRASPPFIAGFSPPPGLNTAEARGINDSGLIVGFGRFMFLGQFSGRFALLFSGGSAIQLGTLGGTHGAAYAVNNRTDPDPLTPVTAQIVGESATSEGTSHAFLLQLGAIVQPGSSGLLDLGTLCPLGTCNSAAFAINDLGQIVGQSETLPASGGTHAFLYTNNQMTDLNTLLGPTAQSQWLLVDARGINDLGQIAGTGFFQGKLRGYLMTPPLSGVMEAAKALAALFLSRGSPVIVQSLLAKLDGAAAAVERQQTDVAQRLMTAYELEVQALVRGRLLTDIQATKLTAGAALIRGLIDERVRR